MWWDRTKRAVCPSSVEKRRSSPSRGRCPDSPRCSQRSTGWRETEAQSRRCNARRSRPVLHNQQKSKKQTVLLSAKHSADRTLLLLIIATADPRRLLQSVVQRIFIQILKPFMTLLHFMNLFKMICCWNHISFNVQLHHVAAVFTKSTVKSWMTLGFLREILILFELRNVYENK